MNPIQVGDLVVLFGATGGGPDYEEPRKEPGIVINIERQSDVLPRSVFVLWPGMSGVEPWFEDALRIVSSVDMK